MYLPWSGSNWMSDTSLLWARTVCQHLRFRMSQIFMVWSSDPVAIKLPFGWKSALTVCFTWPCNGRMDLPVLRSHSLAMPPRSVVTINDPSGWNANAYVPRAWPSWSRSSFSASMSHMRHVASWEVDARYLPDGWNRTLFTRSSWPLSSLTGISSVKEYRRIRESADPVANPTLKLPVGSKATPWTRSSCPLKVILCLQSGILQSFTNPLQPPVHSDCPSGEIRPQVSGLLSPIWES
mmetsp:Transcript_41085/g.107902  ORF Transcript_41085/g.107902 Transcript_41085/m.107902 type:complete len:237 (+) Transcript_41085:233-943(+)